MGKEFIVERLHVVLDGFVDRTAGALRLRLTNKYHSPQEYVVAQTTLKTASQEVFVSTAVIISAFFIGPHAGKTVYETIAFVDNETIDHAWTADRAGALEMHYRFLDLLRLGLALHFGEPVLHQDHWPQAIEATKEVR